MYKIYTTNCIATIIACVKLVYGNNETLNGGREKLAVDFVSRRLHVPDVHWPLGIVHYYFDHKSYDYIIARRVRMVMNSLEDASCLKFKPLIVPSHNSSWILISNPGKTRECVHNNFNHTALEIHMVLGYDCMQRKEIMHSLIHAIGLKDEVTHPQRDQYVRIMWENINPKYHELFRIRRDDFSPVATEYDSMSIMHFHDRAFSKNGLPTIAPLIPGLMIYPAEQLSPLDKMRLRLLFGHECNKRNVGDLLDSCKTVLHNDTTSKEKMNKGENNIGGREYSHEAISSDRENDNNIEESKPDNFDSSADDKSTQNADSQNGQSDLDKDLDVSEE